MNLEKAVKNGYQKLKKNNIKSALIDSEILLSAAINKNREFIILNLNHNISDKEYNSFKEMVNLRSRGKPVAYLIEKECHSKASH